MAASASPDAAPCSVNAAEACISLLARQLDAVNLANLMCLIAKLTWLTKCVCAAVPRDTKAARQASAVQSAVIAMWRGDVAQALATVCEADALTADFVSLAASAGHQAWVGATRLYARKLELRGEPCAGCAASCTFTTFH